MKSQLAGAWRICLCGFQFSSRHPTPPPLGTMPAAHVKAVDETNAALARCNPSEVCLKRNVFPCILVAVERSRVGRQRCSCTSTLFPNLASLFELLLCTHATPVPSCRRQNLLFSHMFTQHHPSRASESSKLGGDGQRRGV